MIARFSIVASMIGLVMLATAVIAAGPVIPDSATPGGVDPSRLQKPRPLPDEEPALFPVPRLVERPLGIDDGPVIPVTRFELEGVDDLPDLDEPLAEVLALIEQRRQERPDGFTMGQMQAVADEATLFFRRNGLILAQVFVPAQDVADGVVRLQLLEGRLGKVIVEGNEGYKSKFLESYFGTMVGEAVFNDEAESALLRVTDLPGISAFGVFQPGTEVGETDIVLRVAEDPWDAYVSGDNYGSDFTGEREARVGLGLNNPLHIGDRLDLMFQKGYSPKLSDFASLTYQVPISASILPGSSLGLGYSRNRFTVGGPELSDFGIQGVTEIANLSFNHSFLRSRRFNLYGLVDLTRKHSEVTIADVDASEDKLAILTLQAGFDAIDNFFGGGINSGYLAYSHGFSDFLGATDASDQPGSSRKTSKNEPLTLRFDKLVFEYSRLQNLALNHSVLLRVSGQWSDDLLVSLEQFAIGGPLNVRAYPQSEFLMDRGVFASLEWIMNAPGFADKKAFENLTWGQILQVSLFIDHGAGYLRDAPATADQSIEITGVGFGVNLRFPAQVLASGLGWVGGKLDEEWQFNVPGTLALRLDIATPIGKRDASNSENPQTFFNVVYSF